MSENDNLIDGEMERLETIHSQVVEFFDVEPVNLEVVEMSIPGRFIAHNSKTIILDRSFANRASDSAVAFMLGRVYSESAQGRTIFQQPWFGRMVAIAFTLLPIVLLMIRQNWIPLSLGVMIFLGTILLTRLDILPGRTKIAVPAFILLGMIVYAIVNPEWFLTQCFFSAIGLVLGANYSRGAEYRNDADAARLIGDQNVASSSLEEVFNLNRDSGAEYQVDSPANPKFQVFYPSGEHRTRRIERLS